MSLTALVALALIAPQGDAGQTGAFAVGGKQVPMRLISTPPAALPADYLSWDGWQHLSAPATEAWTPYTWLNDWSDVAKAYEASKGNKAAVWRCKIFVLTRTEVVERDASGVLRINREIVEDTRLQETLEAIARVKAWVTAEFGGKVELEPDVEIETDIIRAESIGPDFAQWYVGPKINGGTYQTEEDKTFRGPYHSAIYILPGNREQTPSPSVVNLTPVSAVTTGLRLPLEAGGIEMAVRTAWQGQVEERLKQQGFAGVFSSFKNMPSTPADVADPWAVATSLELPAADVYLQRLRDGRGVQMNAPGAAVKPPFTLSWKLPGADASFVDDSERGKVLKINEKTNVRSGGIALPISGATIARIEQKPTLSFFLKSTDRDPISIRLQAQDGNVFWVSAGRDPVLAKPTKAVVGSAPFEDNGQWQKIAVDLRPLAKEAGVTTIVGMSIEPSPNALVADMLELGSGEYLIDDIKLSDEAAQPLLPATTADFALQDPEARALAAAKSASVTPELLAALKDPSSLVRLNATAMFKTLKDPQAESALAYNTGDLVQPIQAIALEALDNLGTETARGTMRQVIRFTLGDYAKATAAKLLAQTKDKKYTGDILLLFTNQSWLTKLAGVEALATLGVEPRARHGFLRSENPIIRLEAVRLSDPKNVDDLGRLMWHAVNDPADRVRALAYGKLLESGTPEATAEGYTGVRDDSFFVRVLVLDYLRAHPSAANRAAIDLALADRLPIVRAAALRALAEHPGEVTAQEVSALFEDKYPEVQLALAEVASKKKVKLPEATIVAMRASPDKRVVEAANAFGS